MAGESIGNGNGKGLQYNQAKERSESGNMDKGSGKEQREGHTTRVGSNPCFVAEIYRRHQ
ncbi:hypothetical protein HPP92_004190 [Vanilla planifolia]|uniref:Uncharacterized protein n=1 Tax=Vanilla planifolia TaxID=51239 RepID=A0A835S1B8_VANPL|nr:hypothetical protein HPP92_004190 [Vanilla planifolia]